VSLNPSGAPSVTRREEDSAGSSNPGANRDQGGGSNQDGSQASNADQQGGPQAVGANPAVPQASSAGSGGVQAASPSQGGAQPLSLGQGGAQGGGSNSGLRQGVSQDEGQGLLTLRSHRAQGAAPRRVDVEPPSLGGRDPSELAGEGMNTPPQAEGLLAESLPIDLVALDRAIEQCLGRIDAMGRTLTDLLDSEGAWPWLVGAVVVTAAGAAAHSWVRRSRLDPLALANGGGSMSSWFLESISDG
jgi:hypothetical protein